MALRRVLGAGALASLGATLVLEVFVHGAGVFPSVPPFPRDEVRSDATPAWSADDTQIAYMTLPPGPLLIISNTGGEPRRLFRDDHHYATPAWSRDGKRLAFASDRGGGWAIWSSRPDGSDPLAFAAAPLSEVFAPAWSPDGSRILYSAVPSGVPKIMTTSVSSSIGPGTRVTDGWRPRWSPDGRRIAYTDRFSQSGQELEVIAVCATDGAAPRRLRSVVVPFSSPHLSADWAPDGKHLVVPRRSATRTELLSVDPDTDTATVIGMVDGYAYDPAWSHDGARIAYSSVASDHPGEIHVMPITGGAPVALTQRPRGVRAHLVGFAGDDGVRVPGWLYVPESSGRHRPSCGYTAGGPETATWATATTEPSSTSPGWDTSSWHPTSAATPATANNWRG